MYVPAQIADVPELGIPTHLPHDSGGPAGGRLHRGHGSPILRDQWTTTIATARKDTPTGTRGFRIEEHRWPAEGYKITLWDDPAIHITHHLSGRRQLQVTRARWLLNDRGLLIEARWDKPIDSLAKPEEAIFFYDFHRGTILTCTQLAHAAETTKSAKDEIVRAVRQAELEELQHRQSQPPLKPPAPTPNN